MAPKPPSRFSCGEAVATMLDCVKLSPSYEIGYLITNTMSVRRKRNLWNGIYWINGWHCDGTPWKVSHAASILPKNNAMTVKTAPL